jgi:hypothetical protein
VRPPGRRGRREGTRRAEQLRQRLAQHQRSGGRAMCLPYERVLTHHTARPTTLPGPVQRGACARWRARRAASSPRAAADSLALRTGAAVQLVRSAVLPRSRCTLVRRRSTRRHAAGRAQQLPQAAAAAQRAPHIAARALRQAELNGHREARWAL